MKSGTRSKNPVPLSRKAKINEAEKRFEEFTGHKIEYIDKVKIESSDVGFKVGVCDGILYTTIRDGKVEHYIHKFRNKSKPLLASNYDGSQLFLLQGKYKFTERGIVDK